MIKLDTKWKRTEIDMDSVDWRGSTIHLKRVPAIQNKKTGKIRVYPSDVAKAELRMLAEQYNLETRDISLLSILFAKPGLFKKGEVHYKYHLNKMLFYQWKEMERLDMGETFSHDEFEPAKRGPVPKNLSQDLKRLEKKGVLKLDFKQWGETPQQASLTTTLTDSGLDITKELWYKIPAPFREVTLEVKEKLFPLDPETIRKRVHRDYPEYKKTYTELDTD
jgi:hypothetical protein